MFLFLDALALLSVEEKPAYFCIRIGVKVIVDKVGLIFYFALA